MTIEERYTEVTVAERFSFGLFSAAVESVSISNGWCYWAKIMLTEGARPLPLDTPTTP